VPFVSVAVDETRVAFMRLKALHTRALKSFILLGLGSFVLLETAVLSGDRDSVDWDGTVFSLEMGGLVGTKYLRRM
jgi:hypothetical protein